MPRHRFALWVLAAFTFSSEALAHDWPDFNELITGASPAVVRIDTYQASAGQTAPSLSEQSLPDTYHDFFEHRPDEVEASHGTGSGFIISEDGYVLTNQHVVAEAAQISVKLIDHRRYDARVVGMDPRSDLALLKIEARELPVLRFASSDNARVGQWVVAIGAPFGLDYSASAGIISAIGRSIPTEGGDNYVPFIQSDVATNPGSSGGPLLNLQGQVVGVNSQIFSRPGGGSIGLSFAIPSAMAEDVIRQLQAHGRVARGWLGVYVQEVTPAMAKAAGLDYAFGAFVAHVQPGSPAGAAGIRAGDIFLTLDARQIVEPGDLPQIAGLLVPGSKVVAELIRGVARQHVTITIGELPESAPSAQ
ncbi:S1C family serine protease [Porticoccus sp.]